MRKKLTVLVCFLAAIFALCGCGEKNPGEGDVSVTPTETPSVSGMVTPSVSVSAEDLIDVVALVQTVTVNAEESGAYDYARLFSIVENGKIVEVTSSMIDASGVPQGYGTGVVICTYKGVSASVTVYVYETVYELHLSASAVTVMQSEADSYNFLQYFTAKKDGEKQQITADMVESDVTSALGTYRFTVTYHGISKTLRVTVDNEATVTAYTTTKSLRDDEILSYDYADLFTVRKSGKLVDVTPEMLEIHVTMDGGYVVCTYMEKSARVEIVAIPLDYKIVPLRESLTLYRGRAEEFDFTALFLGYVDGKQVEITKDMLSSDIKPEAGEYRVTVTLGRATFVLPVTVTAGHVVEVVPAYRPLTLHTDEIAEGIDYTTLFWLYVDEVLCDARLLTFDDEALRSAGAGETATLTARYQDDETDEKRDFSVSVVAPSEPVVTAKHVVTYPNSGVIDLTTLFTIEKDGKIIPVTSDMISGTVDYFSEGVNVITLTYAGGEYTAIVEVRRGVSITPVRETVVVPKGTDKNAYDFAGDFVVSVNGIRFRQIERLVDTSAVDFSAEGEYVATVTVPYTYLKEGTKTTENFTGTVTYRVEANLVSCRVLQETVTLPVDATSYDVTSNLRLTINGIRQNFTDKSDWVDVMTTYYELRSAPLDFTTPGTQTVAVALFVNGTDAAPLEVSYKVAISAGIRLYGTDKAVFTGETVDPMDLFVIEENGEQVKTEFSYISGKVDVFRPGVYVLTATYRGITASSRIVVLDNAIKGVYHTRMTTIPVEKDEDDDGDVISDAVAARTFGDLVIGEDGKITFDGKPMEILGAEDEKTLLVRVGTYDFTLIYMDGVVVLNPDNKFRMQLTDNKRPLLYFNENIWNIDSAMVINRGSKYVLQDIVVNYSVDLAHVTRKDDSAVSMWYGLKVRLVKKTSSDTYYEITYGEATFSDGFTAKKGERATFTMGDDSFVFDMLSDSAGKVDLNAAAEKKYAGRTFNGTIDGKIARLSFNVYEQVSLTVDGSALISSLIPSGMKKNAYFDYENDIVFVYDFDAKNEVCFSYRFRLDLENKTFTLDERDSLFGYYEYGNKYIFLDGYGTGHISFDSSSYADVQVTYARHGNEVLLTFKDVTYDYAGGTGASLYISELLNILTGKEFADDALVGAQFVNRKIVDGAIVTMEEFSVGRGTTKANLRKLITIRTKDGLLSETEKANVVDVSLITNTKAGFYQFTVRLTVEGKEVTAYYAIEYRERLYRGNALVQDFGTGLCNPNNTLSIDEFGIARLTYAGVSYIGETWIGDDGTFLIKARSENGAFLSIKGLTAADGVVTISASGAERFTESFTTGKTQIVGASGSFVLREITVGESKTYFLAKASSSLGEIATVTLLSGSDLKAAGTIFMAESPSFTAYGKVVRWDNPVAGATPSDALRGTYRAEGKPDLTLDGFGGAKLGDLSGTYRINARGSVTFVSESKAAVLVPDLVTGTYRETGLALDGTLVSGMQFAASYVFVCGSTPYTASTTFVFGADGTVTVISTSTEHDEGEDSCTDDRYSPVFASKEGVSGTYTVFGDCVTVIVGETTFTFRIDDVTNVSSLVALSSSLDSGAHGYFSAGTTFSA